MPRFNLREFSTPAYAQYIPVNTVEERPAQKVADLLYFMNTLPWFSKSDDENGDATTAAKNMEGYTPDLDAQEEMAKEAETRHAENLMEGYRPDEAQVAEPDIELYGKDYTKVRDFDTATATPEEIVEIQKIVGTKPDGLWGKKSTAAREDWLGKQGEQAKYGSASTLYNKELPSPVTKVTNSVSRLDIPSQVQIGNPDEMLKREQDTFARELEDARLKRVNDEGRKFGSMTGGYRGGK